MFGSFPAFYNNLYKTNLSKLKLTDESVKTMSKETMKIIQNQFGGKIRLLISGGAPLSQEVFDFLKMAF